MSGAEYSTQGREVVDVEVAYGGASFSAVDWFGKISAVDNWHPLGVLGVDVDRTVPSPDLNSP